MLRRGRLRGQRPGWLGVPRLGFAGVNDVRAGKLIELDLADGTGDAEIEEMCRKLLANTVIENFRIEQAESAGGLGA